MVKGGCIFKHSFRRPCHPTSQLLNAIDNSTASFQPVVRQSKVDDGQLPVSLCQIKPTCPWQIMVERLGAANTVHWDRVQLVGSRCGFENVGPI